MFVIVPPLDRCTFIFTPSQMSRRGGRTLGQMSKGRKVEEGVPYYVTCSMMHLMDLSSHSGQSVKTLRFRNFLCGR